MFLRRWRAIPVAYRQWKYHALPDDHNRLIVMSQEVGYGTRRGNDTYVPFQWNALRPRADPVHGELCAGGRALERKAAQQSGAGRTYTRRSALCARRQGTHQSQQEHIRHCRVGQRRQLRLLRRRTRRRTRLCTGHAFVAAWLSHRDAKAGTPAAQAAKTGTPSGPKASAAGTPQAQASAAGAPSGSEAAKAQTAVWFSGPPDDGRRGVF